MEKSQLKKKKLEKIVKKITDRKITIKKTKKNSKKILIEKS